MQPHQRVWNTCTHSCIKRPSQTRQLLAPWYSPSQPFHIWNLAFWACSAHMASIPSSSQVFSGKHLPRWSRSLPFQPRLAILLAITGLFLQVSKFWFLDLGISLRLKNFSCSQFKPASQRCTLFYSSPELYTLCYSEHSTIDRRKYFFLKLDVPKRLIILMRSC